MPKKSRQLLALLAGACVAAAAPASAQMVTVGATSSTSDAPIFIAAKKGFFREEGLEVTVSNFRSASDMVAPLGAGQLDAGAGSAGAALYNAVARGIRIKNVAHQASSPPRHRATKILVRKDLVESGRCQKPPDPNGLKISVN